MTRVSKVSRVEKAGRESTAAALSSDHAIISDDLVGVIVDWNTGAQEFYGRSAEEMMGQPIAIVIPEHLRGEALRSLGNIFGAPALAGNESVHKREEEMLVQVSLIVSPVRNSQGEIIGASTTAPEITQRQRREECERLAAVVESSDDGIIAQSLDGTIFAWNSGAEKLYGYSASEALGKQIQMLLPPERANEESEILVRI